MVLTVNYYYCLQSISGSQIICGCSVKDSTCVVSFPMLLLRKETSCYFMYLDGVSIILSSETDNLNSLAICLEYNFPRQTKCLHS